MADMLRKPENKRHVPFLLSLFLKKPSIGLKKYVICIFVKADCRFAGEALSSSGNRDVTARGR